MALQYYDAGENVIPLRYGSKQPLPGFDLSAQFKKRASRSQVMEWFGVSEPRNIGLVMGNGQFALDLDGFDALGYLRDCFFEGEDYKLKPNMPIDIQHYLAWSMRTLTGGGGRNIILGYRPEDFPEQVPTQTLWIGLAEHTEIKVKGKNSYVVAAPSLHPSGCFYKLSTHTGVNVMTMTKDEVLVMFNTIRKVPRKPKRPGISRTADRHSVVNKSLTPKQIEHWLAVIIPRYRRGVRNQVVLGLSGMFHKDGYALETALAFVAILCQRTNDEEKEARLEVVRRTYAKDKNEVAGWSLLDFA